MNIYIYIIKNNMKIYKLEEAPMHFIYKEMLMRNFDIKVIFSKKRETLELLLKNLGVCFIHDNSTSFTTTLF